MISCFSMFLFIFRKHNSSILKKSICGAISLIKTNESIYFTFYIKHLLQNIYCFVQYKFSETNQVFFFKCEETLSDLYRIK